MINIAYTATTPKGHMWFSTPHMNLARPDPHHREPLVYKWFTWKNLTGKKLYVSIYTLISNRKHISKCEEK